jgi:hypothetical protein
VSCSPRTLTERGMKEATSMRVLRPDGWLEPGSLDVGPEHPESKINAANRLGRKRIIAMG